MKLWAPTLLLSLTLGLAAGAQEAVIPEAAAPAETAPEAVTQPPPVVPEAPAQPAAPEATVEPAQATPPVAVETEPPAQPAAPSAEPGAPVPSTGSGPADPATAAEGAAPAAAPEGVPAVAPAEAPAAPATAAELAEAASNTDLWHIVAVAHPIVQAVMALLTVAAFAALTILVQKMVEFSMATSRLRRAMTVLASARDLPSAADQLASEKGPGAAMARAATEELRLAEADPALIPGTRERSSAALTRIEAGAAQRLRAGTGLLASIGSLAPFIGLFGTVFGIMNSFLAIAETKTTSLAVVAPGIAEALLATAIGLAAAIPAVLIYNIFSRKLGAFRNRSTDLATLVLTLQSRALDRLAAAPGAAPAPRAARVATGG